MKKLLPISLIINAVVIIGVVMMVLGPVVGNTFTKINSNLSSVGGAAPDVYAYDSVAPNSPTVNMDMPASAPGEEVFTSARVENAPAAANERIVIQTADLSIVVVDPKARKEEIEAMAREMGGFIVTSYTYQTSYGPNSVEIPEVTMTIRVPSEKLDEALEVIKKDAVDVEYENRSGEDVTSQYVDLESRLSAKKAAEKNLLKILDAAETTEATLAVYVQLQQIQTEIEVLVGQMRYYEESAALSAVSIRLVAEEKVKPVEIGSWKLQGTANEAVQDLIVFTQGFTQFLLRFFLNYLWQIILIGLPLYGVYIGARALSRKMRSKEVKKEEAQETSVEKEVKDSKKKK